MSGGGEGWGSWNGCLVGFLEWVSGGCEGWSDGCLVGVRGGVLGMGVRDW